MESFRRVGDEILRRFRAIDYDESALPDIVPPVLEEARLHEEIGLENLADAVLDAPRLPPGGVSKNFSDAGICVYHDAHFVMEVLTWLDAATMAHAHEFCGAFQVLVGGSLHTRFKFDVERRVSEKLLFGRLDCVQVEHLTRGAISPIHAGSRFIHRLFHLERPSITLVVRAFVQGAVPQYAYLEPGIAYDPFGRPRELDQRLKLLRVLERLDHPGFLARLERCIARADLYSAFFYALEFVSALYAKGLQEAFLPTLRERFRELAPTLEEAFAQRWRFEQITQLRRQVSDPEHRFFLALLLNAVDRRTLLSLIAGRTRAEGPAELAIRWLAELATVRGFAALDEEGLAYLTTWLRDGTHPDEAQRARHHPGLRHSILRPLVS